MNLSDEKTYFYTEDFLKYFCERFGYSDSSYINKTPYYTFYAPILSKDDNVESGFLSYLPLPSLIGYASDKSIKKEMKIYLEKILNLGSQRIALRQDPLVNYDHQIIKSLLQEDFTPNIFYTSIIDLTLSKDELWQNIRKSYRSLINSLIKDVDYSLVIVDKDNNLKCIYDWINLYLKLVERSGRKTSKEQFINIEQSIKNDSGYLYLLYKDDELVSGVNMNYSNGIANYSASGTHPDYEHKNYFSHYLLWAAINDLKIRNYKKLEMGPIFYDNIENFYPHSEKELSISDFKLGMGGELTPFTIFERKSTMNIPIIEGDKVVLKPLSFDELESNYVSWLNDEEVCKYNSHCEIEYTKEMAIKYIKALKKDKSKEVYAVYLKNNNLHIGNISLKQINNKYHSAEITYLFGEKQHWGKGYAYEASKILIKRAFEDLGIHRLFFGTHVKNIAMRNLGEKLGFVKEGLLKDSLFKNEKYNDTLIYGKINEKE